MIKYFFCYESNTNFRLENNATYGVQDRVFACLTDEQPSSRRYFAISMVEERVMITALVANYIKVNREFIPQMHPVPLDEGDLIEVVKEVKLLCNNNRNMTLEEAKASLGQMMIKKTFKGIEEGLDEKNRLLEQLVAEFEKCKALEKTLGSKLAHLQSVKKELAMLESENFPAQMTAVQTRLQQLDTQYTALKKEVADITLRLSKLKQEDTARAREQQQKELQKLQLEENELKLKLERLNQAKKRIA